MISITSEDSYLPKKLLIYRVGIDAWYIFLISDYIQSFSILSKAFSMTFFLLQLYREAGLLLMQLNWVGA